MAVYNTVMDDLRYPVGPFQYTSPTPAIRRDAVTTLERLPVDLGVALQGLGDGALDTPYRPGGWTVRQLVHHVPDSHMNAYVRTRMALTEDTPTIKPYAEAEWAQLDDARIMPIEVSLELLDNLHQRWVRLLDSLHDADFDRAYIHPESGRVTLALQMALYSWHSRHHVAHIAELRKRRGW